MRHMTRYLMTMALCAIFFGLSSPVALAKPLKVVATLSTFADLAKTIGGEHVEVSYVAPPRFNPHFIEPRPSDVLKVKRADLFAHAGLDLELWRWPLVEAAGNREVMPGGSRELDLSVGINLLEVPTQAVTRAAGDIHLYGNPHYWLDPENAKKMAETIYRKLSEVDPEHESDYRKNVRVFLAHLNQKISEWREKLIPYQGRELVGYHNSWPYLMEFVGLGMRQYLEPKPGIPPTPRQVEFIESYIKEKKVSGIIQESYSPKETSEALSRRTGAKVVPLAQNVGEVVGAENYISLLDYNVDRLVETLR